MLKTKRVLSVVLATFVLSLIVLTTGCGATGQQTKITVWSTGTDNITPEAQAVEEAIANVEQSPDIEKPATKQADLLAAACDAASPPLAYLANVVRVESGKEEKTVEAVGFEIDLAQAISRKMGLQLQVAQVTWSDLLPSLETGGYDIIVSAMMTSPDLLSKLLATDPYLAADLAICASSGESLADAQDLKGKVVGVQAGTLAESTVRAIDGVGEVKVYAHLPGAFEDLGQGKLDAVVGEELACRWILDNDPRYSGQLAVSGKLETGEGYAFWCSKDNSALLEAMNTALDELRDEGVYQKICDKWGLPAN